MTSEEKPAISFYMLGDHRITYFTGRMHDDYYFTLRKRAPYTKGGERMPAIENISRKTYPAIVAKGRRYLYINDGNKWVAYQRGVRRNPTEADFKKMEEDYQASLRGETKTYSWEEVQASLKIRDKEIQMKIRMQRKLYKRQQRLWKSRPLILTKENFSQFKKLNTQTTKKGVNIFEFEGKKVIADYATILIQRLGHQFKNT